MNVKVCRSKPEEFERSVDVPTDRSDAGGDVGVARDPQGSDRQVAEGRHHPWSVADPDHSQKRFDLKVSQVVLAFRRGLLAGSDLRS